MNPALAELFPKTKDLNSLHDLSLNIKNRQPGSIGS